jgi:hypothetical protein
MSNDDASVEELRHRLVARFRKGERARFLTKLACDLILVAPASDAPLDREEARQHITTKLRAEFGDAAGMASDEELVAEILGLGPGMPTLIMRTLSWLDARTPRR